MAGNPANVKIWEDADVRILKPSDITAPDTFASLLPTNVTAAWDDAWLLAGLLDGSDGFGESREWDDTEHTAWGYGLIKVSSRNFKMTLVHRAGGQRGHGLPLQSRRHGHQGHRGPARVRLPRFQRPRPTTRPRAAHHHHARARDRAGVQPERGGSGLP